MHTNSLTGSKREDVDHETRLKTSWNIGGTQTKERKQWGANNLTTWQP
jgi:hypothetical protein